jgi:hypothetical protein
MAPNSSRIFLVSLSLTRSQNMVSNNVRQLDIFPREFNIFFEVEIYEIFILESLVEHIYIYISLLFRYSWIHWQNNKWKTIHALSDKIR